MVERIVALGNANATNLLGRSCLVDGTRRAPYDGAVIRNLATLHVIDDCVDVVIESRSVLFPVTPYLINDRIMGHGYDSKSSCGVHIVGGS